jgi:hypothetical protein
MGLMSHALRVFARTSLTEHVTTLPASGAQLPAAGTAPIAGSALAALAVSRCIRILTLSNPLYALAMV